MITIEKILLLSIIIEKILVLLLRKFYDKTCIFILQIETVLFLTV